MEIFGIETEAEVVSGQVISFNAQTMQARVRGKRFQQLQSLNRYMQEFVSMFRAHFFSGMGGDESVPVSYQMKYKMCAWYNAAKQIADLDREHNINPIRSFPFVMADILVKVYAMQRT